MKLYPPRIRKFWL